MNMSGEIRATQLPRLAVAMIVRNAEKTLPGTLESIRSVADMIVVADTGSADATVEVARKYTPNVITVPWKQHFAAARNKCLEHVRSQWVLWVDAGERITEDDSRHLRDFVETEADAETAYMMMVRVARSPRAIAAEQVARVRLLPNRPEIQFVGRVREDASTTLSSLGLAVESLPWRIHRTADHHNQSVMINKARRNLELAELEINEHGAHAVGLNCLAEALQTLGENARAGECFRHAVKNAARGSIDMLEGYYGLLTSLGGEPRSLEAQLAVCLESLEVFPLDMQLLCAMGGYLQSQNRLDLAARSYETAYRYGQIVPETWHLEEIREIAAVCFSLAMQNQGQEDNMISFLEEALKENTQSVRLRMVIIEAYAKHQQRDDALRQAELLPENTPHRGAFPDIIDGVCLAAAGQWKPATASLESAYQAGNRGTLCLRWLVTSLIASADVEHAEQILSEWRQLEPANLELNKYQNLIDNQRSDTVQPKAPQPVPHATSIDQPTVEQVEPSVARDRPYVPTARTAIGTIPAPPRPRRANPVRIDLADPDNSVEPNATPDFSRRTE